MPDGSEVTTQSDRWQLEFDPVALKAKYLEERDRRLRKEAGAQYQTIKASKFAHWLQDPWVKPLEREVLDIDTTALILGGGFSGINTARQLKEAGVTDFKIMDTAADFGGTWYWNRYPGAACDSESYCYLPLLEETGYMPSMKYAMAQEIRAHNRRMGKHWDLYPHAIWQTGAKEMRWDDKDSVWVTTSDRGDTIRSKFLVTAGGPLNVPHLPNIEGIETFKGHQFHTSRWDYSYTGGNADEGDFNMTGLNDKKVAFVGTGATGIQAIPYLGASCKELYVFQRTPSAVDVRDNKPTDPEWWKTLEPGWQAKRDYAFQVRSLGGEPDIPLDDGFSRSFVKLLELVKLQAKGEGSQYSMAEAMQLADFRLMEGIRKRVDDTVKDKKTAEILKPWYNLFCKRPVYSDTYLPTFNRPNVHLVDAAVSKGIERITEKGLVVGGQEYEVDCIIWGVGFDVVGLNLDGHKHLNVLGRGGVTKDERWKDGMSTFLGLCTSEFPNQFHIGNAQAPSSVNFPSIFNTMATFVAHVVGEAVKRGIKVIEISKEYEDAWTQEVIECSLENLDNRNNCTPGYYNAEGNMETMQKAARISNYGKGLLVYREKVEEYVKKNDLAGFNITY